MLSRIEHEESNITSRPGKILNYRKVPRFLDARKLCCNLPKFQTKRPDLRVFSQKDANGIANSENPDQTAPRSSQIWVCTVCQDESVRKLRIITVAHSIT